MAKERDERFRTDINERFIAWFEQNHELFNLTAIEKAYDIPPKTIYKHVRGYQIMPWTHIDSIRLYVGRYCATGAAAAGYYVEANYTQQSFL